MIHRTLISAAALALYAAAAGATDLLQVWEAARRHDPQGAIADAARAAGSTRRDQASALWRPTVGLAATAGRANAESRMEGAQFSAPGFPPSSGVSFGTSIDGGTLTRWTVGVKQPLYNAERLAQRRQLNLAADAAEVEWQAAQQDWMLQIVQHYSDVLVAERRLALLDRQREAVERAYREAKERYRVGDAPVTDTHEAAARAQALQAQALTAANDLELARIALSDSTGLPPGQLQLQPPAGNFKASPPEPLAQLLAHAAQNNPLLRQMQSQLDAALAEADKHHVAASPTVDLVAQASRESLSGSGDFGQASNTQTQQMVGIALNVPLYTGGWRSAKHEESLRLVDKARAELERARLQVGQQTRSAWLALQSGESRLGALEQMLTASRARLDATRLGRKVGDRTTLDLLNAENDAAAAELGLLQARIDVLINRLRLDAATGRLGQESLQAANASLQR
ncbi:MAG: type secretion outer membrane protein, TolC family [Rhodocyclaceae bacterium]|nr:type secretion outer membrane protein, TolC family [Rhodocyclaceae bacterium]